MTTVQLEGVGLIPPEVPYGPGVSRLWLYFQGPPAQNSIIIYNNGSVVERTTFENDVIQGPDVNTFILGGTRYRTTVGSFQYEALTDAGYSWLEIPEIDTYTEVYTDVYP